MRTRAGLLLPGVAAAVPLLAGFAWAGRSTAAPTSSVTPHGTRQAEVAPDSPRASLTEFLDFCRRGDYDQAAAYLDLPEPRRRAAPELARRLKAVLDRHLWIDLDRVSALSEGDQGDDLPQGTDEIGTIPWRGRSEPVRLVRIADADGVRWAFAPGTLRHVDAWYAELGDLWLRRRLPRVLLRPGPKELLWWQWAALPLVALLAVPGGLALGWLTRRALGRIFRETRTQWDDALLVRLSGPLTFAWAIALAWLLVATLGLYAPAERFINRLLGAGGVVALFWALWRATDIVAGILVLSPWGRDSASARSLLSIAGRITKAAILGMGLVAALSQLGYPVASLLAGLGLGGLALALAAQKTVENLFGSISLGVDQPFRVGDFVRIEDFVGTIETIGLRSTRIRTLDRTVIAIPNGRLADMRIESFSARDRMRLACTVGLVYGTTAHQMRQVLEGLETVLRSHPRIWPEAVVVRFKELASSSLDIEVMAWFETAVWPEFQLIRQEVLLQFMEVVEKTGTSFAFPTRTVHLASGTPPPG